MSGVLPPKRWRWVAPPFWVLIKALAVGLLLLFGLLLLAPQLPEALRRQAVFFVGVVVAWYCGIRLRRSAGAWWQVLLYDGVVINVLAALWCGVLLGVVLLAAGSVRALILLLPTLHLASVWISMLVSFSLTRIAHRLYATWQRLCQNHLTWALVNAHMRVVVLTLVLTSFGLSLAASRSTPLAQSISPETNPMIRLIADIIGSLFPALTLLFFAMITVGILILPLSFLFSYAVTHRTLQRLSALVAATRALRFGNQAVRIAVVGSDQVAQLQADFNAMASDLQQTLAALHEEKTTVARLLNARSELVTNISHDLRTPVATARSYADVMLSRWAILSDAERQHSFEIITQEILHLQRLIDELFVLARDERSELPLHLHPLDVGALVRHSVDVLAPMTWQLRRVQLIADLPAQSCWSLLDHQRLEQILRNLMHNAVDHTPPGGIVIVRVATDATSIIIEVLDTGSGIAPDELAHIWTRFYRGSSAQTHYEGSGIGLAVVKRFVDELGGMVDVSSSAAGTQFTLRFQQVAAPTHDNTAPLS